MEEQDFQFQQPESAEHPEEPRIVTEAEAELSKWELSFEEILFRFVQFLRGNEYNVDKNKWVNVRKPYMTEEGIHTMKNSIDFNVNRNTFLSNYSIEDVRSRCMFIAYNILEFLSNNYDEFKIETRNFNDLDAILNIINPIDSAYHRSIGGLEREQRNTSKRTVENIGTLRQPESRRGGISGSILNIFSRKREVNKYG